MSGLGMALEAIRLVYEPKRRTPKSTPAVSYADIGTICVLCIFVLIGVITSLRLLCRRLGFAGDSCGAAVVRS